LPDIAFDPSWSKKSCIIEEDFSQEESILNDEIKLTIKDEKVLNVIRAKKEARLELVANYEEVERIEAIHLGKDLIKDTSNQHPTKAYANKD